MPRISDARRAARRTQILDAFRVCVAREGFHRASMAAVIAEADLSAGAVYGHFKSKRDLIHAVAQEVLGFAGERLIELEDEPVPATPEEICRTLLQSVFKGDESQTASIAVQVWAEIARDEELRTIATAHLDDLRDVLGRLVTRCQVAGALPPGDPSAMGRVILALIPGFAVQRVVYRDLSTTDYLGGVTALLGAAPSPQGRSEDQGATG